MNSQQLILTTEQLAQAYEVTANALIKSFRRHKDKFIEGNDYLLLGGDDLKPYFESAKMASSNFESAKMASSNFESAKMASSNNDILSERTSNRGGARKKYFWTIQGAMLHAWLLGTSQARIAYGKIVDQATQGNIHTQAQIVQLQRQNLQLIEANSQTMDILIQSLHDQIEGGSAILNPGNALMQDTDLEDWERLYIRLTNLCKDMRDAKKITSAQFQAVTRLLNEGLRVLKSHLQYLEDHEPLAEAAWNKAYFEVQETKKHQQIMQAQLEALQGTLREVVAPALPQKLLN